MRPESHSDDPFCTTEALVRGRRVITGDVSRSNPLAYLVLSGCFNPIHVAHIRLLAVSKEVVECQDMTVIGGFICPSSDEYVTGKLGRMAMTFEQRRQLCEIAVGDQEWLSVC